MSDSNNEAISYYNNALVPVLKRKNAEMSILVGELEANILLQQKKISVLEEKCKELEDKLRKLDIKNSDGISSENKPLTRKKKG